MNDAAPKVSVCVVTYNHGGYIGDCLTSLVEQQTDFAFEIVVGDDASTDATSAQVDDFARRFKRVIRVLRSEGNVGPTRNYLAVHNAARGEYVAHMDGDDLALPGKLAAQAALLDARESLVACGHRVAVVDERGRRTGRAFPFALGAEVGLAKVIRCGMPFMNSSLMYRRSARTLTAADHEVFDWYFLTDILRAGPAGYLSEELGLYRLNPTSFTASIRQSAMRSRMLANYARRLADLPAHRASFFAAALFELLACVRSGEAPARVHRDLLRRTVCLGGFFEVIGTYRWRAENAGTLAH